MAQLTHPMLLLALFVTSWFPLSSSVPSPVSFALAQSAPSSLPSVDFGSLGTVGLVGAFDGLQFFDPSSLSVASSNSSGAALVHRDASGSLAIVGRTNDGGRINAVCAAGSGTVYLGGLFSSIGGVSATNIASYDSSAQSFSSLGSGTNGEVLSLDCDDSSSRVLVGGTFTQPGQNAASWSYSSTTGSALAFGGLNGAVRAIERQGGSVFFGGDFTVAYAGNGTASSGTPNSSTNSSTVSNFPSIGSALVPVITTNANVWATPTTYRSGFGVPEYLFCPDSDDGPGSSWLLTNGEIGYFVVRLGTAVSASGIRIGNTFFHGDGVRTFQYVAFSSLFISDK
jgi:hypothetical protein